MKINLSTLKSYVKPKKGKVQTTIYEIPLEEVISTLGHNPNYVNDIDIDNKAKSLIIKIVK